MKCSNEVLVIQVVCRVDAALSDGLFLIDSRSDYHQPALYGHSATMLEGDCNISVDFSTDVGGSASDNSTEFPAVKIWRRRGPFLNRRTSAGARLVEFYPSCLLDEVVSGWIYPYDAPIDRC
jgi:hypothetical protein